MAKQEMYPQLKLIFQNKKYLKVSIFCSLALISILVLSQNLNSCQSRQFSLLDEVTQYEQTTNYDQCIPLAEKIQAFNSECNADLDPIECG